MLREEGGGERKMNVSKIATQEEKSPKEEGNGKEGEK